MSNIDKLFQYFQTGERKAELLEFAINSLSKLDGTPPSEDELMSFFETGDPALMPRRNSPQLRRPPRKP